MLDLRSHRSHPYECSLVLRRSSPAVSTPPLATSTTMTGRPPLSPFSGRVRQPRIAHHHHRQQEQNMDPHDLSIMEDEEEDQSNAAEQEAGCDQEMATADVEPAIFRLSPELLSMIFHYVYVTPVVHRPNAVLVRDEMQHHADASSGELSSSRPSSASPLSERSAEAATVPNTTTGATTTTTSDASSTSAGSEARRKRDKRTSAVYIQNDLSSLSALCLTCSAFYPQAIRMLWRQRTLANYDDLMEFYQAIDFSASLRKRQQKQRQLEQQLQRPGMGYAVEEGLFNNEAALRIKSLTLLDMCLGSTLPSSLTSSTDASSALASGQFFGSSSSHGDPLAGGGSLDLCQGIDLFTTANAVIEGTSQAAHAKDTALAASSSSSSSTISSGSLTHRRRRLRQKTMSIYSEMISPRLLNTIANHCYALVDLTICIDNKLLAVSNSPRSKAQHSIPFSIIAGSLLSLKRLSLMGLSCDSKQNKTGSELLVFAQNIHPLERISIRACQGISLETYIEFAARSHKHLLSVDIQGLDLESSQQLTDMMSAYAHHCKNMKSITLSCINGLALDGMIEALARNTATELQELHILGHDAFRAPGQQQGQGAPLQQEQQPQMGDNNNVNNQEGPQISVTQMCHLADANAALAHLAQLPLRRLTLYCPGITDFALFQYLSRSPRLVDMVLNEPTTVLHHPQFQAFVQPYLPANQVQPDDATAAAPDQQQSELSAPFTSAGFLGLILARCPWLKYMFMKLTLETAQEWIVQPCFKEVGLDRCMYQYRTTTGAPAVVMMWDARNKVVKA